ncbi:Hypothetical predicted protein [Cloeon dipterum]|uniref:Trichohyalin-plectin-homology domain-containing protein n=1 Tax=Cloeon dipterum TaxID=197152 RepID=A0A8S1D0I0_9INSE|nr:Hypothetical predicted protein [Cloeon dipterum]
MPHMGGYNQDLNRRMVEQRQREIQSINHKKSLDFIKGSGCQLEFDVDTSRKSRILEAKCAVKSAIELDHYNLNQRQRNLRQFLAEEEKLLLEEHHNYLMHRSDMELETLRQKAAAIKSQQEKERKELVHKKRVQQYKENNEEVRNLDKEFNKKQVIKEQELQRQMKREAEEKRLKEEEEHAIFFRNQVQDELKRQMEQDMKSRCELFQHTRAALGEQLDEKKKATLIEYETRKSEELKLAEKLKVETELEKQKNKDDRTKLKNHIASNLMEQISEKTEFMKQQKLKELQLAAQEKSLVDHFANKQQQEMAANMMAIKQAKDESRSLQQDLIRRKLKEKTEIESTKRAEREKLMAKEDEEMERRRKARLELEQEVYRLRNEQMVEREKELLAQKSAREKEAQLMAELADQIKKEHEDERRKLMLAKLSYREDLKKQMEYAKHLKEKSSFEESEMAKKKNSSEEDFIRQAKQEIVERRLGLN